MRLAAFDDYRLGLVDGDAVRDVTSALDEHDTVWPWSFVPRAIGRFEELRPRILDAAARARPRSLASVTLLPPVPWPGQLVAAAANYDDHHAEMAQRPGRTGPPTLQGDVFLLAPSSAVGHCATVTLPRLAAPDFNYEAELAVVVGRAGTNVPVADALDHVFGYTCLLDLTQRGKGDRSRRKSYRGFTPFGPWITTADEVPDPQDLSIRLWRNGKLCQDGSTRSMVYSVAELIAFVSTVMSLYPGDVIATGTPAGVGPIEAGDALEMEIERIGRLAVDIVTAPPDAPIAEPGLGRPKA